MDAVILAAGRGTRLAPVSDRWSKAMVPVLGRPLVERVLDTLLPHGIRRLVLVVGPGDQAIRHHFAAGGPSGLEVHLVNQEQRLGMAHALRLAAPLLAGPFLLSACDSITSAAHVGELLAAFARADAALSLLDVVPDRLSRSAVVALDGDCVLRIVEKPEPADALSSTISLPLYALPPEILELAAGVVPSSRGEVELQDAIQALIDRGRRVVGVRAADRRQVSTPGDLLELSLHLVRAGEPSPRPTAAALGPGTTLEPPCWLGGEVAVGAGCRIGPDVVLEAGCRIGERARLRRAVVLPGAVVAPGEAISGAVVA